MYKSIITHNDFDGVVSAALCSYIFGIENIKFAGPNTIARAQITITNEDIVCDLPYPLECGLWFDHHEGNLAELSYRNIPLESIDGKFETEPSCARVIYNYAREKNHQLPDYFHFLIQETDMIDSFDYHSIEDWREESPGKIIDASIKTRFESNKQKNQYLRSLVLWLRDNPIETVIAKPDVREKYDSFLAEEKDMLKIIEKCTLFLPQDSNQEIIVIDLTGFKQRPHILKNLAYLLHPNSLAVVEVHNLFKRGIKSNDLSFSISLSINLNHIDHHKDAGDIVRELNIGDGHAGAAAGTVYCDSKNDMLKQKQQILEEIYTIWQQQV